MGFLVFSRRPRSYVLGGRVGMGHRPCGWIVLTPPTPPRDASGGTTGGLSFPSRHDVKSVCASVLERLGRLQGLDAKPRRVRSETTDRNETKTAKRVYEQPLAHADRSADFLMENAVLASKKP